MRSIFLSNNESVLAAVAAASRLSSRWFLGTIAAAEVEEVLPVLFHFIICFFFPII
jgi:hypothetical protein